MLRLTHLGNGIAPGFIIPLRYGRLTAPPPPPTLEEMPPFPALPDAPIVQMPVLPPAFPTRRDLPAPGLPPAIVPYPGLYQESRRTAWRGDPDWVLEAQVKRQQFEAHSAQIAAAISKIGRELLSKAKKKTGLSTPGTIKPYRLTRLKAELVSAAAEAIRKARPSEIDVWVGDSRLFQVDLTDLRSLDKANGIWKRGKEATNWIIQEGADVARKLVDMQFFPGPLSSTVYSATQSGRVDALREMGMNVRRNPGYRIDWPAYDKLVALTVQHSKAKFAEGAQYDDVGYLVGPTALVSTYPESEWIKQAKRLLALRGYTEPKTPRQTAPAVTPEGQYTPPPGAPALPQQAGPLNLEQATDQGVLIALHTRGLADMNMTIKYERRYWQGGARYFVKTTVPGSPMPVSQYQPLEDHAVAAAKVAYMQSGGDVNRIRERDWKDAARRNLTNRHYKPI